MYIGEVSKKTGLSVKAIRLYEQWRLIPVPKRVGRYRVYTESDIDTLLLIKEAKSLGVTLAQLQSLITYKQGQLDWSQIEEFLLDQKHKVLEQIRLLNETISRIDGCLHQLHTCQEIT